MSEQAFIVKTDYAAHWDDDDYSVRTLAADASLHNQWALVYGEQTNVERLAHDICGRFLYAKAGVYIDAGGAERYVDDRAQIVHSACDVLRSLRHDPQVQAAVNELGDSIFDDDDLAGDVLRNIGRAF